MPYLKSSTHDMFVSYAHGPKSHQNFAGDNGDFQSGWARQFVDHLTKHITYQLGEKAADDHFDPWMDPRLETSRPLDSELKARVQGAALLLCILDEYYLKSPHCLDEITAFLERHPNAIEQGRIFVVITKPVPRETWPTELSAGTAGQVVGIDFYSHARPGEPTLPLGWPKPDFSDPKYKDQLLRLGKDLEASLRRLKYAETQNGGECARPLDALPRSVGRSVLIGYGEEGEEDLRNEIREHLRGRHINVWPPAASEEPVDEASVRGMLEKHLPNVHALVLILGPHCGRWPKGERAGHVSLQLDAARAAGVPAYVWLTVDDLDDVKRSGYQEYLQDLERAAPNAAEPFRLRFGAAAEFAEYCAKMLDGREPAAGAEQWAIVWYNSPVEERPEHSSFREIVLDTVADGGRPLWRNRAEADGRISLVKLREELEKADVITLICFDDQMKWTTSYAAELHKLIDDQGRRQARLVVVGPRSLGKGVIDLRTFGFMTIDGTQLEESGLRESIRNAIDGALRT